MARTLLCTTIDMGWLRGKSPWPNKRRHRKGGGLGEFERYFLRGKTPQSSGGGPESKSFQENVSIFFEIKNKKSLRKTTPWPGVSCKLSS